MSGPAAIDTNSILNFKYLNKIGVLSSLKYYIFTTICVIHEMQDAGEDTKVFFDQLLNRGIIQQMKLGIEDLVEMASIPNCERMSDAELSCIVKAKSFRCKTICEDKSAIKFIKGYIDDDEIIGIKDIIEDAYMKDIISDSDVSEFQEELRKNNFVIKGNLLNELAEKKLLRHR